MNLGKRIERLSRRKIESAEGPSDIVMIAISPITREAIFAHSIFTGIAYKREKDEAALDFDARLSGGGSASLSSD